jgi:hypothetical protein
LVWRTCPAASGKNKSFSLARCARGRRAHRDRKIPKGYCTALQVILFRVFSAYPAGSAREKAFQLLFLRIRRSSIPENEKPRSGIRNGVRSSFMKGPRFYEEAFKLLLFLYHQSRETSIGRSFPFPAPFGVLPAKVAARVGAPLAKMAIRARVFLLPIPSPGAEEKALRRHLEATLPHDDEFLFLLIPLFICRQAPPDTLIPYSQI